MNSYIVDYVKKISDDKKIQDFLITILDKILLKQEDIENYIKENENKIIHIRDWIISVVENGKQWKKPRVLTIDALNNAADKYFEKKNNKLEIIVLDETHEKLVADLGDYYIVQMLTPEALDNESKVMQHCIGHGWYDQNLNNGKYQYLSLRDKYNKAHVTLEVYRKKIEQLQGKQNDTPDEKYLEILLPWLVENRYNIDINEYGFVVNKNNNKIYLKNNLPDNCKIDGCLNLRNKKDIKKLPDNLIINGELDLSKSGIEELPNNLTVNGDIYLIKTAIKNIPKSINVKGSFYLEETLIEELPDDLIVNGDLFLENCEKITKLPKKLVVKGNLNLRSCKNIVELPKKLKVLGNIDLSCSGIKNINNLVECNGSLILIATDIKEMPEYLNVKGDLNLYHSEQKELPKGLIVGGTLDLTYARIKRLPDDLKCRIICITTYQVGLIKEEIDIEYIKINKTLYTKQNFFEKFYENGKVKKI